MGNILQKNKAKEAQKILSEIYGSFKMDILMVFDDKYSKHAAATMCSIIKNNGTCINFHVMYSSISQENIQKLTGFIKKENCNITFYKVNKNDFKYCLVDPKILDVTQETFYRILAVKYLPETIHRCLYIDTDVIILDSIKELFELNLDNYALAAVPGYAEGERKVSLGMPEDASYFQAGVILFNLDYWREHNTADKVMNYIKSIYPRVLFRVDQDALNSQLYNQFYKLPLTYNTHVIPNRPDEFYLQDKYFSQFSLDEIAQAKIYKKIIHYTGHKNWKPWWQNSQSPYSYHYFYYRSMTPYKVKKLPKFKTTNHQKNKIKIFNKMDSNNISVVVQGAISADTITCLKSIRKHLPKAEIILSTYKDSITQGLDYDKLILNDDPGAINIGVNFRPLNINRQIFTTLSGIRAATRMYVLKIRTDAKMTGLHFCQIFDYANTALNKTEIKYKIFKNRIICSSNFTRNPESDVNGLCFQISDLWLFGLKEDLNDLFDIPLQKKEEALVLHNNNLVRKYTPEQYILLTCLKKHGFTNGFDLNFMNQKDKNLILNTKKILINNFLILNQKNCGISEPKKFKYHPAINKAGIMTTYDLLTIYKTFYENNYTIPYIFANHTTEVLRTRKIKEKLKKSYNIIKEICMFPYYILQYLITYTRHIPKLLIWYFYN